MAGLLEDKQVLPRQAGLVLDECETNGLEFPDSLCIEARLLFWTIVVGIIDVG